MATISSDLSARFAAEEVAGLGRRFGGALEDNPDGAAILELALEQAVEIGFDAWCKIVGPPPDAAPIGDVWASWHAQRALTPEAASWPRRLENAGAPVASDALARVRAAVLAAGAELGLTGFGRGRFRRGLVELAEQAAEAGASLRCALDAADREEEPEPVEATASPDLGVLPRGDTVRVLTAATLTECELVRNLLASAGIPTLTSHSDASGAYYLTAAGAHDVYVPLSAADEARIVLSTVEDGS